MENFLTRAAADALPAWTALPFVFYLLAIAALPLLFSSFWDKNRNKCLVAATASAPVAGYLFFYQDGCFYWLLDSLKEYAAFMALLLSLFIISGGIHLKGHLAGTPAVNTLFLAVGAILANVIGTTGASVLLIRPLLRANEKRAAKKHVVIFFIFIVSNGGGLLTPLGDPPLFLGFLRGVPFLWTLQLWAPWALVNGILLAVFHTLDKVVLHREELKRLDDSPFEEAQKIKEPLRAEGTLNFLWLLGVVGVIFLVGAYGSRLSADEDVHKLLQVSGMLAMAALAWVTTKPATRYANRFHWEPIVEVVAIFFGVFVTMVPVLKMLESFGASERIAFMHPWQFFWMSGTVSSFLDNAPTYLVFTSLSVGVMNKLHQANLSANDLGALLHYPAGILYLKAVSCGAVFMGANTYIGNAPNFMVKAMAERSGVKMPGFFGYMLWSGGILIPLFILMTFLFF